LDPALNLKSPKMIVKFLLIFLLSARYIVAYDNHENSSTVKGKVRYSQWNKNIDQSLVIQ